jgi:uncharacterized peroxidase-related enzyme
MPFIKVIHPDQASGRLKKIYDKVTGPGGQVDNVLQIHSLRPHTLEGHMALYKSVLHHPRNELPKWFLEAIGVLVSLLNDCSYCAKHHAAGMKRLMSKEPEKFEACLEQLHRDHPGEPFTEAELAALEYARKLTLAPGFVAECDLEPMRKAGYSDGEIFEVNQVAAYFAYANRTVTGLGVHTEGEQLGMCPPNETEDWHHG